MTDLLTLVSHSFNNHKPQQILLIFFNYNNQNYEFY